MSQVASKTGQEPSASVEDVEELLDTLDKTLDRLKTLYEQYFLGIQKQAPAYIHSDVERKLRDLMQLQIRNTGLRYRLTSIQAKFGAYNSYWRRTLRQIENGSYVRNLHKIGRAAARSGADIPEEILAAMPKRMREQVLKDREAAIAAARRHKQVSSPDGDEVLTLEGDEAPAFVREGTDLRRQARGAHVVQDDGDFDLDAFFKQVEGESADDKTPQDQPPVPLRNEPAPVRAATIAPPQRQSSPVLRQPTGPQPAVTPASQAGQIPRQPTGPQPAQTGPVPRQPTGPVPSSGVPRQPTGPVPAGAQSGPVPSTGVPRQPTGPVPAAAQTGPVPRQPTGPVAAPSQTTRPIPIAPGAAAARGDAPVESMAGPFARPPAPSQPSARPPTPAATQPLPRATTTPGVPPVPSIPRAPGAPRPAPPVSAQSQPITRPTPAPRPEPTQKPPPGMTDADVNALYAKYVKAKEAVGEKVGPGGYGKLLNTINSQAPKIMEQYKAKGVDFSVVVKDNQVIIRAKPKP